MRLSKVQEISILFLTIIFFLIVAIKGFYFTSVSAQQPEGTTTANVTIMGYLDDIVVEFYPVNFTPTGIDGGLATGVDEYPKYLQYIDDQDYINISTGPGTNVKYNISINASNMTDGLGHYIPVNEIKINSTDCGLSLTELSEGEPQLICQEIPARGKVSIYFYLDVPAGQYNSTYDGDIWIYTHSYAAREDNNNRTWYGVNNTTARIKPTIEIVWDLKPILFGTLIPGDKENATANRGFPTNISTTPNNNVYVDLYINGTNLYNLADPTRFIGSDNVTYVDAPDDSPEDGEPDSWPYDFIPLDLELPTVSSPPFPNWAYIPNSSYRLSWWNITIPLELITGEPTPGGDYVGDVRAKAVDTGYAPV